MLTVGSTVLLLKHNDFLHVTTLSGFLQANLSETLSFEATLNKDWLFICYVNWYGNSWERSSGGKRIQRSDCWLWMQDNLMKEDWQGNRWLVKQTEQLMNEVVGYQKLCSRTQASVVFSLWSSGPFTLLFGPLENNPLEIADSIVMRMGKLDIPESVHRDTITTYEVTNKMQLYRLIYYS
jgi:hypothetical protein